MPEPEDAAARADAELRAAQELASRARRARDAAAFVLQVLMTGWIVLTELDAIFRHRFADFPAAVDHRKFKEKYDELEAAALQSQEIRGDAEPMLRELESEVRRLFEEHSEKRPERTVD